MNEPYDKSLNREISKNDFKEIADDLGHCCCSTDHDFKYEDIEKRICIATSIINKYDHIDKFYLKCYLDIFFWGSRYIDDDHDQNPLELEKIKNILPNYKLSKIIKLFLKKLGLKIPKKSDSLELWFNDSNTYMFNLDLKGLSLLVPYLKQDIKTPNKFESCKTALQQFLFILFNYNYLNQLQYG